MTKLLSDLERGDVVLWDLSEEELGAILPREDQRLVPLTTLDELADVERSVAVDSGLRSLKQRGLIIDDGNANSTVGPSLSEPLGSVLWLRENPSALVIADRVTSEGTSHVFLYGLLGKALLEERVDEQRVHHFVLRSVPTASLALGAFVDPFEYAGEGKTIVEHLGEDDPEGWDRVTAAIDHADAVTRVFVARRPAEGDHAEITFSVVATPGEVWVVYGYEGDDGGAQPTYRAKARLASPEFINALVTATLGAG